MHQVWAEQEAGNHEAWAAVWDTPNAIAIFSPDDRLIAANSAFEAMFCVRASQHPTWHAMMKANYHRRQGAKIDTDDIDEWLTAAASRRGTMAYRAFEAELYDGRWLWVTETVSADGTLVLLASDVTALRPSTRAMRKERDAARRDSMTDELTGVANRRYVMGQIGLRLEELAARPEPATHALAIIDLDKFKTINDTHGHEFGDIVLIAFARLAVSTLRTSDLFGRIGGEEFVLLMPNCGLEVARDRLKTLLETTRAGHRIGDAPPFGYTFSAGVVAMKQDETMDNLIKRADRLLYRAKNAGRNTIVLESDA